MSEQQISYLDFYQQWSFHNWTEEQIAHDLSGKGFVEEKITEIIQHYKKKKQGERSSKGFVLILVGGFIGFLSCLFTLLGIFPEIHDFILVGLTTIGICIAVYGCYHIFE